MSAKKLLIIFILSFCLSVGWRVPVQSQTSSALDLAIAAQQFYEEGELTQSATTWQAAAQAYGELNNSLGKTKSQINQAQVLQDLGLYPKACDTLLSAFELEKFQCDREGIAGVVEELNVQTRLSTVEGIGLRSLARVLRHNGALPQARQVLQLSKVATRNTDELGATLLELGNVERSLADRERDRTSYDKVTEIIERQVPELALDSYQKAFIAYQQTANEAPASPLTRIQARINQLNLLLEIQAWWQKQSDRRIETWQRQSRVKSIAAAQSFARLLESKLAVTEANLLAEIEDNWQQIPPSRASVFAQINYSQSLTQLGDNERVKSVLTTALTQAKTREDKLAQSYVLGYLAKCYERDKNFERAIALTERALVYAQTESKSNDTREATYLWQSQLGHLWEETGKIPEAIAAYTSAFNTLQALRTDLNASDRAVRLDFRQEVKPVYLHLADLLLQSDRPQALESFELVADFDSVNPNLELARQVIESLQVAELDNFFQDPCSEIADSTITVDRLDPEAAVVYPIVLSDRLEVILSLPNRPLQKFTTPVTETTVNRTVDLIYDHLYNPSVDNSAVNIFSTTLVDPIEIEENMQTLLPLLQTIHSWTIEPLIPSLTAENIKTLVFVLNGNLQNVPISALYDGKQYLLEQYGIALAPSLQLLNTQPEAREKTKVLAAGLSQQVEIQGNIFPALHNVPLELNRIQNIFPQSDRLLNVDFTTSKLEETLESGFSIVHLATHGKFSSNPEDTFIVTGDGQKLDIETLSNLLNSSPIKPELVVLSACETAKGDDRAILGLAGVTVRSGTSSTIASLWSVDDASTAQLMKDFYQAFANPTTKKVDALRKAQVSLINSLRQEPVHTTINNLPPHPYYWSPYVLVGNWK